MLRRRAFDAMRSDILVIDAEAFLEEVSGKLLTAMEAGGDLDTAAITAKGKFVGVLGVWELLNDLNDCALEASLRTSLGPDDFESTYREACRRCMARHAADAVRREAPVVAPAEPLHLVLDAMIKAGSRYAAVVEGGKLLGLLTVGDIFREIRSECCKA